MARLPDWSDEQQQSWELFKSQQPPQTRKFCTAFPISQLYYVPSTGYVVIENYHHNGRVDVRLPAEFNGYKGYMPNISIADLIECDIPPMTTESLPPPTRPVSIATDLLSMFLDALTDGDLSEGSTQKDEEAVRGLIHIASFRPKMLRAGGQRMDFLENEPRKPVREQLSMHWKGFGWSDAEIAEMLSLVAD